MTRKAKVALLEARLRWWRFKAESRLKHFERWKQAGDRAHYWLDQNKKHGNAKGVVTDEAEIRQLSPLVHKWETKWQKADKEVHRYNKAIAVLKPVPRPPPAREGYSVPATRWNPYRRKIANWIVRELTDAVAKGAEGVVTSGLRSFSEQKRLFELFQRGGNIAARPGLSNHEGYLYPRGAVDWSEPESLNGTLARKRGAQLKWAETHGLRDFVHFSSTGR